MKKAYLGDGVYVEFDYQLAQLILTTENGIAVTNRIVLEAEVYAALTTYVDKLKEQVVAATSSKA